MFIKNPRDVFAAYVRSLDRPPVDKASFDCGQLAMALEIITQIKVFEEMSLLTDAAKEECISALHTILTDTGIEDEAYRWYEMLGEWRTVKLIPVVADASVLRDIALLVGPASQDPSDDEEPSAGGGPERGPVLLGTIVGLHAARQRNDPVSAEGQEPDADDASGESEPSQP